MAQEQETKNREARPPREGQGQGRGPREGGGGPRRDDRPRGGGDDRRGGDRPRFEGPPEIELEKLISDSLYLDNQAHGVVSRMRDMDSGTKSQLRRLYNAVRRAYRSAENERQHEFVMLRARLAYTIARHGLRSLDQIEKLLLQVTRKNDARELADRTGMSYSAAVHHFARISSPWQPRHRWIITDDLRDWIDGKTWRGVGYPDLRAWLDNEVSPAFDCDWCDEPGDAREEDCCL